MRRHEGTKARRHEGEENAIAHLQPSCLRASVPSCLSFPCLSSQHFLILQCQLLRAFGWESLNQFPVLQYDNLLRVRRHTWLVRDHHDRPAMDHREIAEKLADGF